MLQKTESFQVNEQWFPIILLKKQRSGAGRMAWALRALLALAEELGSILSTRMVQLFVTPVSRRSDALF